MNEVATHYARIRAAIAAAERKRGGAEKYSVNINLALLATTADMLAEMAVDLACSRSEVIRRAIEEYAKDFRFGRGR